MDPGPEKGDPMMEALEGERVEEGLSGDPLSIIKERRVTGYLMISGIEDPTDAALVSIDGEIIGAEVLSDDGRWMGQEALDRIKALHNTWIDLFRWNRASIEAVMSANPKAKIVMTKEDLKALLEERRRRRIEALRSSKNQGERGKGLTGLFAKVSEQVKGLEPDHRAPEMTGEAAQPEEIRGATAPVTPAADEKTPQPSPEPVEKRPAEQRPPLLTVRPQAQAAGGPETTPPAAAGEPTSGKSFEDAIHEGIDELKRLSRELDSLLGEE